jgi:hypothetical protein
MVTSRTVEKIGANLKVNCDLFAPGTTDKTAVNSTWLDLRDYQGYGVLAMFSEKTGAGITALEIAASESSDGSSPTIIKSHDVGTAPDAEGDTLFLEVDQGDLADAAAAADIGDLRYVMTRITLDNASDEVAVTHIRRTPRYPKSGLTADEIA